MHTILISLCLALAPNAQEADAPTPPDTTAAQATPPEAAHVSGKPAAAQEQRATPGQKVLVGVMWVATAATLAATVVAISLVTLGAGYFIFMVAQGGPLHLDVAFNGVRGNLAPTFVMVATGLASLGTAAVALVVGFAAQGGYRALSK